MKTLVNKNNPEIRITAPEIIEEEEYYTLDGENVFLKDNWTLVEEEPAEGIKGNLEEIPSNVDLEKDVESWFFNEISHKINIEHTMYHYFQECARRYFELGLNARKKE